MDENYISTAQALKKYSITVRTLRYWDIQGVVDIKQGKNNYRYYNQDDIEAELARLKTIKR